MRYKRILLQKIICKCFRAQTTWGILDQPEPLCLHYKLIEKKVSHLLLLGMLRKWSQKK
ncbi:hypothetical protein CDL12_09487 [Handroanthus impetiginosus]|uniref:Uncharacterized protein n=1 Tax=Handroanthus impetiginosus TaxID=429701 RepID=A0A2G9HJZ6_9LAMI|nr:hypothetical protein CDL12_09487 [Handroanthus impetiginosus]